MIALQTVRSLASFNIPFFGGAPKDDLVTRVAKVAYRILEYLFRLIESGVDYLMRDIEPEPFHIRYKWSIRITLVAISVFGMYMGSRHIKNKMTKYLDSFIPDFFIAGSEKISKIVEWLFAVESETNPESRGKTQSAINQIKNLIKILEGKIRGNNVNSDEIKPPESSQNEIIESPSPQEEEHIEFSLFNLERFIDNVKDACYFGKELTINGTSDFSNYVTESRLYCLFSLIADGIMNIQKDGNGQIINFFDYILEKVGVSDASVNDLISKALSNFLTFLGLYKLYGIYRLKILESGIYYTPAGGKTPTILLEGH